MVKSRYDLDARLVEFCVSTINISSKIQTTFAEIHLCKQLIRSSTSAALNYGEAQGGVSKRDFVYRMKVVLKELRETFICLKIIYRIAPMVYRVEIDSSMKEVHELISIFVKSIQTAKKGASLEEH